MGRPWACAKVFLISQDMLEKILNVIYDSLKDFNSKDLPKWLLKFTVGNKAVVQAEDRNRICLMTALDICYERF